MDELILLLEKLIKTCFRQPKVLSIEETIDILASSKSSISRFGDGELNIAIGGSVYFQEYNEELSKKLREILLSDSASVYVGLPLMFYDDERLNRQSRMYWSRYFIKSFFRLRNILNYNRVYLNANFTRFYIGFSSKELSVKLLHSIKKIWNEVDVLLVEGEKSKLGIGNDLFDNVNSLKRIISPSKNAFDFYDQIFEAAQSFGESRLILIALGPTASVLAYELGLLGYWAIDIGHVDKEYEWMKLDTRTKIPISKSSDETYTSEILKVIK
jgi:glycosyltransferase family protein